MKAEKKRQEIIKAGMDLFIAHGFKDVSVEDICHELGISKPTLYKYVKKKENILAFYYQQRTVDALPGTYGYLKENRPAAGLQFLFVSLCGIAEEMGPTLYSTYRGYMLSDPTYLSIHSRPQIRVLELCIGQLQEAGTISSQTAPHKLAMMLMDVYEGMALSWASQGGGFDLLEEMKKTVRIMLGVRVRPAVRPFEPHFENQLSA